MLLACKIVVVDKRIVPTELCRVTFSGACRSVKISWRPSALRSVRFSGLVSLQGQNLGIWEQFLFYAYSRWYKWPRPSSTLTPKSNCFCPDCHFPCARNQKYRLLSYQHIEFYELLNLFWLCTLINSPKMSGYFIIRWTGLIMTEPILKQTIWLRREATPSSKILLTLGTDSYCWNNCMSISTLTRWRKQTSKDYYELFLIEIVRRRD